MNINAKILSDVKASEIEYKEISSFTIYQQPTKYIVKSTNYNSEYDIPVLTAGQTFILGYTNETDGIYHASKENPVIIFDDFTGSLKWVDFDFKVKSSAMKIITTNKTVLIRYLYHLMTFLNYTSSEHKRLWISIYSKFLVPIPSLRIQEEIVNVLDSFTGHIAELTAQLTAELTARKKHYLYYRDQLLSFHKLENGIEWKTLNQFAVNCDCQRKPVKSENRVAGGFPYYGASGVVDYVSDYIFDGDYLLISEDGANLVSRNYPIAFSITGKNWVNNHAHVLKFDSYELQKYVEIYINFIDISKYVTGGAQPKLNQNNLNKIPIPLPNIDQIKKIVSTLDKFDFLFNDLSISIHAEITARQKQYDYYRDKLLTFKRVEE